MIFDTYSVDWTDPEDVKFRGVDMGRNIKLVRDEKRCIVLKVPGQMYWSGIGMQSYAPAQYVVLIKPDNLEPGAMRGELLAGTEWPVRNQKT